jgi:hypothetical protein
MTLAPAKQLPLCNFLAESAGDSSFPVITDYSERFEAIDKYLNKHVHPHVNQGAAVAAHLWLTDHGAEHVQTVIRRAGDLVGASNGCCLSPYEAYILLLAAHFHDVGNVFGRIAHEQKISKVIGAISPQVRGNDMAEWRLVKDIATAHGGYVHGDEQLGKDTIRPLLARPNQPVRVALLAAVLRFADELADDNTRVPRFPADGVMPKESEAFHRYAEALSPVQINAKEHEVNLNYVIGRRHLLQKCGKHNDEVFLFDEILERILKLHREHIYCTRFMQPSVHIARINIEIAICDDNALQELRAPLSLTLEPLGYPDSPSDLRVICPELQGITGQTLKAEAEQGGG